MSRSCRARVKLQVAIIRKRITPHSLPRSRHTGPVFREFHSIRLIHAKLSRVIYPLDRSLNSQNLFSSRHSRLLFLLIFNFVSYTRGFFAFFYLSYQLISCRLYIRFSLRVYPSLSSSSSPSLFFFFVVFSPLNVFADISVYFPSYTVFAISINQLYGILCRISSNI